MYTCEDFYKALSTMIGTRKFLIYYGCSCYAVVILLVQLNFYHVIICDESTASK